MSSNKTEKKQVRNILVVDNQFRQFEIIMGELKNTNEFEVFPKTEVDFIKLLNWVHIRLNNRYSHEKRQEALDFIINYLIEAKIDLMIIDFKLSGCHDGKNGIDLMFDMRNNIPGGEEIPVIFLSRTDQNNEMIKDFLSGVKNKEKIRWVNKGYAGMNMVDANFFEKHILNEIPVLLSSSIDEFYISQIEIILKRLTDESNIDDLHQIQREIKETESVDEQQKDIIDKCFALKEKGESLMKGELTRWKKNKQPKS